MTPPAQIPSLRVVRSRVLAWYRSRGRTLPWRSRPTPYRVLVSEMMLQQTQVSRVLPLFSSFLRSFPTTKALSQATPGQVLRAWQGLGYNRRALRLHEAARAIQRDFRGRVPQSYEGLRELPGIGDYTARAILCFAFGRQEPVIDVNLRRVLSRLFRVQESSVGPDLARRAMPRGKAFEWNQAMMDIGALFCTSRDPDCDHCPLGRVCPSAGRVVRRRASVQRFEPSRHGTPRRIYRGRVLKEVSLGSRINGRALALRIGLRADTADVAWLREVIDSLVNERLVLLRGGRVRWSVERIP